MFLKFYQLYKKNEIQKKWATLVLVLTWFVAMAQ
jgi:hypothetical protein